jgi:hypothetical protein
MSFIVSAPHLPTFELFLDDDRYAVPTLQLVVADDERAVLRAAQRMLDECVHHLGVEVCLDGERLEGLGSFATRRLPPEARRGPLQD